MNFQPIKDKLKAIIDNYSNREVPKNELESLDQMIVRIANRDLLDQWQAIALPSSQQQAARVYKRVEGSELRAVLERVERLAVIFSERQAEAKERPVLTLDNLNDISNPHDRYRAFETVIKEVFQSDEKLKTFAGHPLRLDLEFRRALSYQLSCNPHYLKQLPLLYPEGLDKLVYETPDGQRIREILGQHFTSELAWNYFVSGAKAIVNSKDLKDLFLNTIIKMENPLDYSILLQLLKSIRENEELFEDIVLGLPQSELKKIFEALIKEKKMPVFMTEKTWDLLIKILGIEVILAMPEGKELLEKNSLKRLSSLDQDRSSYSFIVPFLADKLPKKEERRDSWATTDLVNYLAHMNQFSEFCQQIVAHPKIDQFLSLLVGQDESVLKPYLLALLQNDKALIIFSQNPVKWNFHFCKDLERVLKEHPELGEKLPLLYPQINLGHAKHLTGVLPFYPQDKLPFPPFEQNYGGKKILEILGKNFQPWMAWDYYYNKSLALLNFPKDLKSALIEQLGKSVRSLDFELLHDWAFDLFKAGDQETFLEIYRQLPSSWKKEILEAVKTRSLENRIFNFKDAAFIDDVIQFYGNETSSLLKKYESHRDALKESLLISKILKGLNLVAFIQSRMANPAPDFYLRYVFTFLAEARALLLKEFENEAVINAHFRGYLENHIEKGIIEEEFLSKLPADVAAPYRRLLQHSRETPISEPLLKERDSKTLIIAAKVQHIEVLISLFYQALEKPSLENLLFLDEAFLEMRDEDLQKLIEKLERYESRFPSLLFAHFAKRQFPKKFLVSQGFISSLSNGRTLQSWTWYICNLQKEQFDDSYPLLPKVLKENVLKEFASNHVICRHALSITFQPFIEDFVNYLAVHKLQEKFLREVNCLDHQNNPLINHLLLSFPLKDYISKKLKKLPKYSDVSFSFNEPYLPYIMKYLEEGRQFILEEFKDVDVLERYFMAYQKSDFLEFIPQDRAKVYRSLIEFKKEGVLDAVCNSNYKETILVAIKTKQYLFLEALYRHPSTPLEVLLFIDEQFSQDVDSFESMVRGHFPLFDILFIRFKERKFPTTYLTSQKFWQLLRWLGPEGCTKLKKDPKFQYCVLIMKQNGAISEIVPYLQRVGSGW